MSVPSTWFDRDLPVLEAIITLLNEKGPHSFVSVADIADFLNRTPEEVYAAAYALGDEYLSLRVFFTGGDPRSFLVTAVTSAARRAVGQWPSEESVIDALLDGIQRTIELETDSEERSKLQKFLNSATGVGREVLVGILTSALTKGIGGL